MRWIDIPPVWLAGLAALAWLQADRLPVGPPGGGWVGLPAGMLVGGGALVMALAVVEMQRARTTVLPHGEPAALVTSGVFRVSRNPIYLGDAMVLAGLALYWGAWPSLALVALFVWLATDRFIRPEEARLRARFGAAFEAYARRTRRWL